jgi:hypothetical protein
MFNSIVLSGVNFACFIQIIDFGIVGMKFKCKSKDLGLCLHSLEVPML